MLRLSPFHEELRCLDSMPGVGQRAAEVLLAEVGTSVERFPQVYLAACRTPPTQVEGNKNPVAGRNDDQDGQEAWFTTGICV